MPFYLRSLNNKRRWDKSTNPDWLSPPDIPVHPLADLLPKLGNHTLSLWWVESDKSNLKRVAAAIAAGREKLDKFEYALFPEEVIEACGASIAQIAGETPDEFANNHWHWDVVKLTADGLVCLAKEMYARSEIGRILPAEICQLILRGISSEELRKQRMSSNLLGELQT